MIQAVDTIEFKIFMAGDVGQAKQVCREYCLEVGLCVTVTPTTYIYTGGEEQGFVVGLINYPRFPSTEADLGDLAVALAKRLRGRLCQHSYTLLGPKQTEWDTLRS